MKANEKAKELLDRFLNIEGADDCGNSYSYVAQQCALICVSEILSCKHAWNKQTSKFVKYWTEVKEEILKIK
jgi:hypothetical protein